MKGSAPERIAIVGCGFTGTSALVQLVDRFPLKHIVVFERSGDFGPGYPYRGDDAPEYLLNNRTDSLCLVPGERRGFLNWLEQQPTDQDEIDPAGYLPRSVFGAFLKDAFRSALTLAAIKGVRVTCVPAEVTSIEPQRNGELRVRWSSGEHTVDAALLTTGRCPPINTIEAPPLESNALFIDSHIRTSAFDHVPPDATVHVLGASLSAYDVVNRLFAPASGARFTAAADGRLQFEPGDNQRRVVLYSRSGRLKAVQSRTPLHPRRCHFTSQALAQRAGGRRLSLADVSAALVDEAAAQNVALPLSALANPYQVCEDAAAVNERAGALLALAVEQAEGEPGANGLVDLLADAQLEIWETWASELLSPAAKQRYRAEYESAFLTHFAPCPVPTARKLLALHAAGRLVIRRGAGPVTWSDEHDAYLISHEYGVAEARVVVDSTGRVDRRLDSPEQPPLVASLANQGVLRVPEDGVGLGAAVDMSTFRAHPDHNIYVANMLLWGPGFFTSSALMMALVVERLLEGMFAPSD